MSAAIYGKGIVPYQPSSTRVLILAHMTRTRGVHTGGFFGFPAKDSVKADVFFSPVFQILGEVSI